MPRKTKDVLITVKACDLIEDFALYPRNSVSGFNVSKYTENLRAGVIFPQIVVEKKSLRIADGFTRTRSYIRAFGSTHEIQVIARHYKSDSEFFADAVFMNTQHGQPLSTQEKVKCILQLQEMGASADEIQVSTSFTQDKIQLLMETRTAISQGEIVPLKLSMKNMAGRKLKKNQNEARRLAPGYSQLYAVNALLNLLKGDVMDWSNEKVVAALQELHGALDEALARVAA